MHFSLTIEDGKRVALFVLLQSYLAGNVLSFGLWKEHIEVFTYMILFYGAWLVVLTLLLLVFCRLRRNSSLAAARVLDAVVPVLLSMPFLVELYAASININIHWALLITLLLPALLLYYHLGPAQFIKVSCVMAVLVFLALFIGHAPAIMVGQNGSDSAHSQATYEDYQLALERRPNVHVIMLDAFTHTAFTREFMDMENPAADYLAGLDDAIYAGAAGFVEAGATKASWVMLFELEQRGQAVVPQDSQQDRFYHLGKAYYVVSGRLPSRLTVLLRENDYFIQTGFSGAYFGRRNGDYVDHYLVYKRLESSLLCLSAGRRHWLGLCSTFSQRLAARVWTDKPASSWPEAVINRIIHAEEEIERPVFSGYYIYDPIGHTPHSHSYGNEKTLAAYKRQFAAAVERARDFLRELNSLRIRYPDSIFIVSGDHGPWLTRDAYRHEAGERFWILDTYGVALALLNASKLCPGSRQWLVQQRYLTPARMLAAALACDGKSRRLTEGFRDNEDFVRLSGARTPSSGH